MFNIFKKKTRLLQIDISKKNRNQIGSCIIKMGFPENMPQDEIDDIKERINQIIDDVRKYL